MKNIRQCSNCADSSPIWKALWNLKIPNASKMFMWSACNNLLPTRDNLLRRKVVSDPACPLCNLEAETVLHILWGCPAARDVWGANICAFQKCAFSGHDFMEAVEHLLQRGGHEDFSLFVGIAKNIWFRRNEVSHGGSFAQPNSIVQAAVKSLEEFIVANTNERSKEHSEERQMKWTPPPISKCKVNWDIALDKHSARIGVGVVIRDHGGYMLAARSITRLGLLDPFSAETFGAYIAASFCREIGFFDIILEGDSLQVVKAVASTGEVWTRNGHLVADVRLILQSFRSWTCCFVKRLANNAAHNLAKLATQQVIDRVWLEDTLNCIRDVVLMEQNALSVTI